jgi:hypothetical protein
MHILVNISFKFNKGTKVSKNEPNVNADNSDKDFGKDDVEDEIKHFFALSEEKEVKASKKKCSKFTLQIVAIAPSDYKNPQTLLCQVCD